MTQSADPSSIQRREFQRILLVKPSSLGDVIHALPVLHGLRVRYPNATISWLVATPFAPLIENHPDLDHVILFDRQRFGRLARGVKPTTEFITFVRGLRQRRFDLVIDIQGLFRSAFLGWATGAGARIGFSGARELAWLFYTHKIPVDNSEVHAAVKNYGVSRLLGFADAPMEFDLGISGDDRAAAVRALSGAGISSGDSFWTVWPGSRWETKCWKADRFSAAIDAVHEQHGLRAVLMGGPGELELCNQIAGNTKSDPAVLAGKTGIREAAAVLELADMVLAHDSAPMHMAAALGRPLVALLGPTNRNRTGPFGNDSSVMQAELECAPCYLKRLAQCPYDHRCMNDLQVGEVVAKVGAALRQVAANGAKSRQNGGSNALSPRSGADTAATG